MATIYTRAGGDVLAMLAEVSGEYFPALAACDPPVRIAVLMAANEDGDALRRYGAGAAALIKRVPKDEWAAGGPDLRILIDEERWRHLEPEGRRALLAHELNHIDVQYYGDGRTPKTDASGRIKIRLRPDDWVLTGFRRVVDWFGEDAIEMGALRHVQDMLSQRTLPFGDPDGSAVVARAAAIEREELASA